MTRNRLFGVGATLLVIVAIRAVAPPLVAPATAQSPQPVMMPAFEWDPDMAQAVAGEVGGRACRGRVR